jgi:hypothetical protein
MMHSRSWAKYVALTLAALIASSCDTRLPTQTSTTTSSGTSADGERPVVTFTVAGALNNAVPFGQPIGLSVKVTDNVGVSSVLTSVRNGAVIIALDTVTIKPTVTATTRSITIPLAGVKKTDKLTVRTTATDAAANTRVDSTTITFAAPTITIITPLPSAKLNIGDSLLVTARVQDGAGIRSIAFIGYSLRGSVGPVSGGYRSFGERCVRARCERHGHPPLSQAAHPGGHARRLTRRERDRHRCIGRRGHRSRVGEDGARPEFAGA